MGCCPSKNLSLKSRRRREKGAELQVSFRPTGVVKEGVAAGGRSEEEYLSNRTSIENENVLLEGLANGKLELVAPKVFPERFTMPGCGR